MGEKPDLKVVSFAGPADDDRADVLTRVEETLQQAKDGEIAAIAIAVVRPDGSLGTCWSSHRRIKTAMLLGAVGYLHHRLAQALFESPDVSPPAA